MDPCFQFFQSNTSFFFFPIPVFFCFCRNTEKGGNEKKRKGKPKALQKGKLAKKKTFARNMKKQKKLLSEICGMERYIYIYFLMLFSSFSSHLCLLTDGFNFFFFCQGSVPWTLHLSLPSMAVYRCRGGRAMGTVAGAPSQVAVTTSSPGTRPPDEREAASLTFGSLHTR